MLVASEPGKVQLLPALPQAWPTGTIEGVLCRGQIEIKRLHWSPTGVQCTLRSGKAQNVLLELPSPVYKTRVQGPGAKVAKAGAANQRKLTLPASGEVTVEISFQP
jgi:hypothetical protein